MTRGRRLAIVATLAGVLAAAAGATLAVVLRPLAVFESMERLGLRWAGLERRETPGPRGPQVYWRGGDGPPVVFLHGANDQAGAWVRIVRPVMRGHRVVLIDLAGHGDSAPADGPLAAGDLVAGVEAVMDAEVVGAPATLVGNSLGGWLALVYARAHPERVSHVVLVNGAAVRGDGTEAQVNLLPRTREEARQAIAATMSPASPPVPGFVLDDLVRRGPQSPLARLEAAPVPDALALDGHLGELRVPVTLIWGADDRVLPLAYAERVAAALPAARVMRLERCGHVPQRECPGALGAALAQALASPPKPEGER
jgi:pimeloyl-ACP methyl ester carboxylesterase